MSRKATAKKPVTKKWWFWVIVALLAWGVIGAALGLGDTPAPAATQAPAQTQTPSQETEVPVQTPDSAPAKNNPLDAISIPAADKIAVYHEYDALLTDAYTNGSAATASSEEARKIEDSLAQTVAEKYGISIDDVKNIFLYAEMGYLYDYDVSALRLQHGDLLNATITGTTLIVKAKITSSYSNETTVSQNYYNVCDLIRNQGAAQFEEIQYWAVADMSNGSEQKVVSFTVPKSTIDMVASAAQFADNTLGGYVTDLWVHQSLR